MNAITPVTQALDKLDIPYRTFTHTGAVRSLAQAADERGHRPEQVVRSLLFRLAADEFVMVLIAGGAQVPWPTLRHYLGQSRITTASQDELKQVTGYEIGAVAPFGLPQPVRLLIDDTVLQPEEISLGSGVRGTTVILQSQDLLQALGANAERVNLFE